MCGRFTLQITPEMLVEIFGLKDPPTYWPRFNIAPTQQVADNHPILGEYIETA
jgi:putative SOS response-associated peptidase YedK